jgi:hypothetical protein
MLPVVVFRGLVVFFPSFGFLRASLVWIGWALSGAKAGLYNVIH